MNNPERKIFNHPIRKETTKEFYPNKIDIQQFKKIIAGDFDSFIENMKQTNINSVYIEEWVEVYLRWLDIEREK